MKVNVFTQSVRQLKISDVPNLDLINVYLEDIGPKEGRIIIECYGKVWCSYWGAMGSRNITAFFMDCNNDYLIEKLDPTIKGHRKKYLERIINTIKEALNAGII